MRSILFGLLGIATLLPAQDLRLYYRQANGNGTSTIFLVPTDPAAELSGEESTSTKKVARPPHAMILTPRPGQNSAPSVIGGSEGSVSVCPQACDGDKLLTLQGKPYKGSYLKLVTGPDAERKLNEYPGQYEEGFRHEAILTLKNLWIDGRATSQTVVIPTTLQLVFQEGDSIYEDGVITFRVTFVPEGYESEIGKLDFWNIEGLPTGVEAEGVSLFDTNTRALKFYLPNMVRQPDGQLQFSPKGNVVEAAAQRKNLRQLEPQLAAIGASKFSYNRPGLAGQRALPALNTTGQLGRTNPFRTNAAVVSQDLPLFLRAAYTYNQAKPTGRHVFNIEAAFAADSDFSLPPIKQTALTQLIFSPQFKLDLNTARTLDNPNSIVWNAPITLRRYLPGKYVTDKYHPPHFRMIALTSGILGEHSVYGQSQNIIVPVKGMVRYSTRPGAWRFAFDVRGGPEMGYSMTEKIERIVLDDPDLVENPAEFVRKITLRNRNIRRLALETKVNLTQGKKASLQFQWQYRKLFREEQYITERDVKGTFTPGTGQDFFGIPSVPTTYTLMDTGQDMRIRRYMEANFEYALTENFSVDIVYKRGVKPPTFQMVNQVMIGFSFSLGKPKE
ncbi:MAG TPA: hypothetical protein VFQ91_02245 [Bryobacteraceae bacterium]|nr:hypothetical protein [Bryobacteraceae bacterium]